jgi:hypothetical protein
MYHNTMPGLKALLALHNISHGRCAIIVTDVSCAAGCSSLYFHAGLCTGVHVKDSVNA